MGKIKLLFILVFILSIASCIELSANEQSINVLRIDKGTPATFMGWLVTDSYWRAITQDLMEYDTYKQSGYFDYVNNFVYRMDLSFAKLSDYSDELSTLLSKSKSDLLDIENNLTKAYRDLSNYNDKSKLVINILIGTTIAGFTISLGFTVGIIVFAVLNSYR